MKSSLQKLEKTFETVYREQVDPLFRFVEYRVSNRDEALDIVEETFLRFWQTLRKEEVKEPRAFLFRTARNLVIDWYRKKKSIAIQSHGEAEEGDTAFSLDMFRSPVPGPETEIEARMLIDKINELEPIYREAVYLRYVEELTPKEISAITGEATGLISVRINRGLKLLKAKFEILRGNE